MDQYLKDDLTVAINNFLDIWSEINPNRILTKIKLHVLTHLPDDIRRFGPTILYSTEVFEGWNSIFCACSILSNHLAPSHDISCDLAQKERFKHIASGGWWSDLSEYIRAGLQVIQMGSLPEVLCRLGWANRSVLMPGTVKLVAQKRRETMTWEQLGLPSSLQNPSQSIILWHCCLYIVSHSGDKCGTGAWVVFDSMNATMLGRISHILAPTDVLATKSNTMAVIELFEVKSSRTHYLDMPVITSSHSMQIVPAANIVFAFNAQHDCRELHCRMVSAGTYERQEQLLTNCPQNAISHNPEP
ncbi:hypothetical protein Moror_8587 [Moniliophthora roreri MCA 2997]|uniref:Uncharacterized protein n=2 Tax=Moniliophthora roreri TaxID=221103 RepID=V2YDB4_MONRO|nr:hypothetical protein Moror_8587 [Moniliophthora roreri MCA 2997]